MLKLFILCYLSSHVSLFGHYCDNIHYSHIRCINASASINHNILEIFQVRSHTNPTEANTNGK